MVLNVQLTKIVTDRFAGREISTALGILLTSWPLGIAVAMATLGFLADSASWHVALFTTAAFSAVALAAMALGYREGRSRPARPCRSAASRGVNVGS